MISPFITLSISFCVKPHFFRLAINSSNGISFVSISPLEFTAVIITLSPLKVKVGAGGSELGALVDLELSESPSLLLPIGLKLVPFDPDEAFDVDVVFEFPPVDTV